jgi:hypothetical protein
VGVVDKKISSIPNEDIDIDGFGAELAFCKMANIYPDLSIEPRCGGHDAVLRSGFTVDIKQTRHQGGKLLATTKKSTSDADIYVLMVGQVPDFVFMGWVESTFLLRADTITDLGYGPTHCLSADKLNKGALT